MDGNLASECRCSLPLFKSDFYLIATYTLIHSFLTKHSHVKAAQAVKKAAKDVVVLKDDIETNGPQLDQIIKEWKASSEKKESYVV